MEAKKRLSPNRLCKGYKAIRATIVEQLGFEITPLCFSTELGLISGITNGTVGSIRKAELLSITTQPCLRASSVNCLEMLPPALKMAKSSPWKASGVVSRTVSRFPQALYSRPADREDASKRVSATGNSRNSSKRMIS